MAATNKRAGDVTEGDRLDLENDAFADYNRAHSTGDNPGLRFEFAEVYEVERETHDCVVLHTSLGSFGFLPDHLLALEN